MYKKIIMLAASLVLLLCLAGCGETASYANMDLEVGETYQLHDLSAEEIDEDWTFTSDNEDVAYVRDNKFIVANESGTATITVVKDKATETYDVTVYEADEE